MLSRLVPIFFGMYFSANSLHLIPFDAGQLYSKIHTTCSNIYVIMTLKQGNHNQWDLKEIITFVLLIMRNLQNINFMYHQLCKTGNIIFSINPL